MEMQIFTTKLRRFVLRANGLDAEDKRGTTIVRLFHQKQEAVLKYLSEQRDGNLQSQKDRTDTKKIV